MDLAFVCSHLFRLGSAEMGQSTEHFRKRPATPYESPRFGWIKSVS